uniref:SFRICE_003229 n=1 Tax=Spodoptera frugiperda TaxID=7108 RepID=A0A2H1V4A8_SPOFR
MLVLEQRLSARHLGRGVVLSARLVHGVEAQGWRMKFSLLKAEVEIEADPATYRELARRLNAANVHVRPARRPRLAVAPKSVASPIVVNKPVLAHNAILASNNQMKTSYCQETNDVKVNSPPCHSPGAILPDLPQPAEDPDKNSGLSKEASSSETQAWLARNRFSHYAATFNNFSGADLLRLTRDEIIQICGFPDGIRLFNALHATRILPRLTVYVCPAGSNIYSALYLHNCRAHELLQKLNSLVHASKECETVLVSGPNGARVRLTDDLVRHMPDNSFYRLERVDDCGALLLCATNNN